MFFRYFSEIKNRIVLIFFSKIITVLVAYLYKETLLFICISTVFTKNSETYCYFISTHVTDIFYVYVLLTSFVSTHFTIFYILYQLITFIAPALHQFEYRKILFIIKNISFMWAFGVFIFYILVFPFCWLFFLSFIETNSINYINVYLEAQLVEYIKLYINCLWSCVILSQFFVMILCFFDNVIITKKTYVKKFRKFFYIFFLLIGTFLTPPDVISQIIVFLCFICIFECSILLVNFKKNINLVTN